MKVEERKLDKIIPYHKNAKQHEVGWILESILIGKPDDFETWGQDKQKLWLLKKAIDQAISLDADGTIIKGHGRLKAAYILQERYGLDSFPVVVRDDLTPEQVRLARLADNRSSDGGYDAQLLASEIQALHDALPDYDLDDLGLSEDWLDSFPVETPEIDIDDPALDEIPEAPEPITQPGDLWTLGRHRLLCGDSTLQADVDRLMNGGKAVLWITDPPYGVSYAEKNRFLNAISPGNRIQEPIENDSHSIDEMAVFWEAAAKTAFYACNEKAPYYWFACQGGDQMMMMMSINQAKWKVRHELIWVKNNHVLGRTDYAYKHEPILYGWKQDGTHQYYGGFQTSVLEFDKPLKSDLHPTMKPVALISKLIQNSSQNNGVVFDGFGGSGSTLIACEKTERTCYMMEIDAHYCDVLVKRWETLTGQTATR